MNKEQTGMRHWSYSHHNMLITGQDITLSQFFTYKYPVVQGKGHSPQQGGGCGRQWGQSGQEEIPHIQGREALSKTVGSGAVAVRH